MKLQHNGLRAAKIIRQTVKGHVAHNIADLANDREAGPIKEAGSWIEADVTELATRKRRHLD